MHIHLDLTSLPGPAKRVVLNQTQVLGLLLFALEKIMIRQKSLSQCGIAASFALFFLFTFASLVSGLHAQSTPGTMGGSVLKPGTPPAFVVAPSIALGYSPTSVATGHLTGSGKLDVVTADYVSGKITVFAGLGSGSFATGRRTRPAPIPLQ
jgi:hypothetical protein